MAAEEIQHLNEIHYRGAFLVRNEQGFMEFYVQDGEMTVAEVKRDENGFLTEVTLVIRENSKEAHGGELQDPEE